MSATPLAPRSSYTWADHIAACLFALAVLGGTLTVIDGLTFPEQGIVSDLDIVHPRSSTCHAVGRITSCRNDIDLGRLTGDDPFNPSGLTVEDLECHQVKFRSPASWLTGTECVSEEEWTELDIGDEFQPTST